MYLTGEYQHSLDPKVRLTLPAGFRKQLDKSVVLVPVPFENAIYGFTPEGHEAWVQSYFPEGFNPRSRKDQQLRRSLNARAVTVEIDQAGRVALGKLPDGTLAKRGIEREVTVIGNADHFEIWSPEEYQAVSAQYAQDEDDLFFDD